MYVIADDKKTAEDKWRRHDTLQTQEKRNAVIILRRCEHIQKSLNSSSTVADDRIKSLLDESHIPFYWTFWNILRKCFYITASFDAVHLVARSLYVLASAGTTGVCESRGDQSAFTRLGT